jgi:hypothetical protein
MEQEMIMGSHTNDRQSVHMREMYRQVCFLHYYCVTDINSTEMYRQVCLLHYYCVTDINSTEIKKNINL